LQARPLKVGVVVLTSQPNRHPRDFTQTLCHWVVSVQHGSPIALLAGRKDIREQASLGLKIPLHITVVVEMIASEVGENADVKVHTIHSRLIERMRGGFKRHSPRSGRAEIAQPLLQLHGPRRGELRGPDSVSKVMVDCSNDTGWPPGPAEKVLDHHGGRRLAVGPRHTDDKKLSTRMGRPNCRELGQCEASRACDKNRALETRRNSRPIFNDQHQAVGRDLRDIVVSVGSCSPDGHEY
jgi:hypothetical protein